MATGDQLSIAQRGGGRLRMSKHIPLTLVSGHIGVTAFGSITGGSGGANGTYPLKLTGGTVSGGPAAGTVTVAAGAVTAISLQDSGDYTAAPTAVSFANVPGLIGASVASITTVQLARGNMLVPAGSRVEKIRYTNATAITGAPTNLNVSAGKTFLGADYVASVDLKAAQVLDLTPVVGGLADQMSWPSNQYLYIQALVVGVTTAGGASVAEIFFSPPNPGQ